ncbi:MAG: hypothetical protein KatS3mg008_1526 [Acidimicrobiales bacterium]|nr:MAG: hypothetical protein KatS3mg008_1526 [Acidimicrobiales bacterium]
MDSSGEAGPQPCSKPETDHERAEASPEIVLVTMIFEAARPAELAKVLAKYVVMSRRHEGCRNIDFALSVTDRRRFVVVEKWASHEAQRRHFDSKEMVEMAESCRGLLTRPPQIDLLESVSAHDLF